MEGLIIVLGGVGIIAFGLCVWTYQVRAKMVGKSLNVSIRRTTRFISCSYVASLHQQ